jgi:hypothetical protein
MGRNGENKKHKKYSGLAGKVAGNAVLGTVSFMKGAARVRKAVIAGHGKASRALAKK